MNPNDDHPSLSNPPPQSPHPPPSPLPPRWRFVSDAKKSFGYSSADAGRNIAGLSAEELAAKYKPPWITGGFVGEVGEVGRLRIEEGGRREEELVEGEFGGFRVGGGVDADGLVKQRSEEEAGVIEGDGVILDMEGLNGCQVKQTSEQEEELERAAMSKEAGEDDPQHTLSTEDTNQPIGLHEDDLILNPPVETIIEPDDVSFDTKTERLHECINSNNNNNRRILTGKRRKWLFSSLLVLACALTLVLCVLLRPSTRNESRLANLSVRENTTYAPSVHPSRPAVSSVPSSTMSEFSCPTSMDRLSIDFIQRSVTERTRADIIAIKASWILKEVCSGEVISGCLPCQAAMGHSLLFPDGEEIRLFHDTMDPHVSLIHHSPNGSYVCLSSFQDYVLEIQSGVPGNCCGFAASRYIVTYNNIVVVEGDTSLSSDGTTERNVTKINVGSRGEPCPTKVPSYLPREIDSAPPSTSSRFDPNIKSNSPSIQPSSIPTSIPTCSITNGDFNLCFAVDMSGSVCNSGTGFECNRCEPSLICNADGVNLDTCCSNFLDVVKFTKLMVSSLASILSNQNFSLVTFATNATMVTSLTSSKRVLYSLDRMVYTGGLTNHAEAIRMCQQTLDASLNVEAKNLIMLITDDVPSEPKSTPPDVAANQAAEAAKEAGSFIIPVMIGSTSDIETEKYIQGISSDGSLFTVLDFESLETLTDNLTAQVSCQV